MTSTLSRLSEASATSLMCSGRLSRPSAPVRVDLEPELRGDHHLLAERCEGLADELFVGERTVDFSGIEEGDAAFDGGPNQGYRRSLAKTPSAPLNLSPFPVVTKNVTSRIWDPGEAHANSRDPQARGAGLRAAAHRDRLAAEALPRSLDALDA